MPIQAQAADHEPVEVAGEEVGQVEGSGLLLGECGKRRSARVDLVAVGALESGDALFLEDAVQQPAGPAVRVRNEQLVAAGGAGTANAGAHCFGDPLGPVMERGRQAGQVHLWEARPDASTPPARGRVPHTR